MVKYASSADHELSLVSKPSVKMEWRTLVPCFSQNPLTRASVTYVSARFERLLGCSTVRVPKLLIARLASSGEEVIEERSIVSGVLTSAEPKTVGLRPPLGTGAAPLLL